MQKFFSYICKVGQITKNIKCACGSFQLWLHLVSSCSSTGWWYLVSASSRYLFLACSLRWWKNVWQLIQLKHCSAINITVGADLRDRIMWCQERVTEERREVAVLACAGLLRALGNLEHQVRWINSSFKTESGILQRARSEPLVFLPVSCLLSHVWEITQTVRYGYCGNISAERSQLCFRRHEPL